jgi:hypothetical protein
MKEEIIVYQGLKINQYNYQIAKKDSLFNEKVLEKVWK